MTWRVADIRNFYQSRLGRIVARHISAKIQKFWPHIPDDALVIGLGYAISYMPIHSQSKATYLAAMPASQGVVHWPWRGAGRTVLVEDYLLPFDDQSIDYLIVIHNLEYSEHLDDFMKEIWRCLKSSGRLLLIVPNRRGIWARMDHTPFGAGQPYSNGQIRAVLKEHQFISTLTRYALFFPPLDKRFILSSARLLEWIGERFFPKIGGVTLIEASKQLYAVTPQRQKLKRNVLSPQTTRTATQARISAEKG